jgi:putative transposase
MPQAANQCWSLDFVGDAVIDRRRFRILAVLDDFTGGCLSLIAVTSMSGARLLREFDVVIAEQGKPLTCVSDKDAELTSMAILRWSQERAIEWRYIARGKPTRKAFMERFSRRLRDELLNEMPFTSLGQATWALRAWKDNYNTIRPHGAISNVPRAI